MYTFLVWLVVVVVLALAWINDPYLVRDDWFSVGFTHIAVILAGVFWTIDINEGE